MKIRLVKDIPVKEKFGLKKGRLLDAERVSGRGRGASFFLVRVLGEDIKLWLHEVDVVADQEEEG
jgi:hypothetical protein